MADKPGAELVIDEALVRALVTAQAGAIPDAATLSIAHAADGWDCSVWRLGEHWAVRLPRRAIAAPLVLNEQRVLPALAALIEPTGLHVPAPVVRGAAGAGYPWAWSVVPWIEGSRGIEVPRAERTGWAEPIAAALAALHVPAPADFPVNPFRGLPLVERTAAVQERLAHLHAAGALSDAEADAAASVWADGLSAAPWDGPPVWIHGDLHPGNLIAQGPRLTGIIDFGDVTAGDPAYDLALAWLAFDRVGRDRFTSASATATTPSREPATWVRARAWAMAVALMLLMHSDDNPPYAALGREAFVEVIGG
ncbi:aminoglycoside phosphotransferase family protein [Microbacterium sp. P5_E9]